jgi:hypothetical protein
MVLWLATFALPLVCLYACVHVCVCVFGRALVCEQINIKFILQHIYNDYFTIQLRRLYFYMNIALSEMELYSQGKLFCIQIN